MKVLSIIRDEIFRDKRGGVVDVKTSPMCILPQQQVRVFNFHSQLVDLHVH